MRPKHAGALPRDPPRQRPPRKPRPEEINDVRIAKQIVEERLDRRGGVRPSQLEQNHADLFRSAHLRIPTSPLFPRKLWSHMLFPALFQTRDIVLQTRHATRYGE